MHRNTLIDKIRKQIDGEFSTHKEAAEHFGITNVWLSKILNSEVTPIPSSILDWAGYEAHTVTTYHKMSAK